MTANEMTCNIKKYYSYIHIYTCLYKPLLITVGLPCTLRKCLKIKISSFEVDTIYSIDIKSFQHGVRMVGFFLAPALCMLLRTDSDTHIFSWVVMTLCDSLFALIVTAATISYVVVCHIYLARTKLQ